MKHLITALPRPTWGQEQKLLRGMFAAASFARAGKMMGARIQHTTGGFDPADISGDKEARQEKVRSRLYLC